MWRHLTILRHPKYYLEEKVCPEYVKQLEGDKETVEDVVGREELDKSCSIIECRVEDPCGIESTPGNENYIIFVTIDENVPGDDPNNGEDHKDSITSLAIAGVSKQFCKLKQVVSAVMDEHHQGSYSGEVGWPGEHHESNGGVVMYEHLPEVFPLNIKELADW